jgi:hypothetical protein
MQKKGTEVPEYGTIEMRKAVGIFEYIDPKGRKPVAYTKVMKKYNLTEEQVLEEAKKLNMVINPEHFVTPETEVKRGRPKTVEKEPKEKGTRGRPKKSKKVVEIDGENEDLFATLVATANEESEDVKSEDVKSEDVKSEDLKKAENEAKLAAKAEEKAAKEAAKAQEKAAKEAAKAEEKAAKEAAKAQEKAAKEAAKAEKEAAKEAAKAEKEAKLAEKASKPAKASKAVKEVAKEVAKEEVVEEDEEPDVVKKIEFEGKKYLKSKKTGIIYDYNEYTKNGEQVVVGK